MEFKQNLERMAKGHVKVQTAWVSVKSVDWDKKTMVATGLSDDCDYIDVLLGIESYFRKPEVGCKCLIGIIENQDAAAFLIDCEKAVAFTYQSGTTKMTMDEDGFVLERGNESLTKIIGDFLQAVIVSTYTNGAGTTSPPNNLTTFQQIKLRMDNLLK